LLSDPAKKFLEKRAFAKIDESYIKKYHPFYPNIDYYKEVEKYNGHAFGSACVTAFSTICGLIIAGNCSTSKPVSSKSNMQNTIPFIVAAAGLVGYAYFINRGKKAAEKLYTAELEADANAINTEATKKEKLTLIEGGLRHLENSGNFSVWKLEDPADRSWFTVPTSVPLKRRIKQLEDLKINIKKEEL
jgi:hypothetical protein